MSKGCNTMKDRFFDLNEELVDFAELNGFDFVSGKYVSNNNVEKNMTFKYGKFDVLDVLKSIFAKSEELVK